MSTLAVELHPQACNVKCTSEAIFVELLDGRTISAPLVWFPRLSHASNEQLTNWELLGDSAPVNSKVSRIQLRRVHEYRGISSADWLSGIV